MYLVGYLKQQKQKVKHWEEVLKLFRILWVEEKTIVFYEKWRFKSTKHDHSFKIYV
jgi:hypothetical protein